MIGRLKEDGGSTVGGVGGEVVGVAAKVVGAGVVGGVEGVVAVAVGGGVGGKLGKAEVVLEGRTEGVGGDAGERVAEVGVEEGEGVRLELGDEEGGFARAGGGV